MTDFYRCWAAGLQTMQTGSAMGVVISAEMVEAYLAKQAEKSVYVEKIANGPKETEPVSKFGDYLRAAYEYELKEKEAAKKSSGGYISVDREDAIKSNAETIRNMPFLKTEWETEPVEFFGVEHVQAVQQIIIQKQGTFAAVKYLNDQLRERGTVVYCEKLGDSGLADQHRAGWIACEPGVWDNVDEKHTHTAIMVNLIARAEPDSWEKVGRDMAKLNADDHLSCAGGMLAIAKRARKLAKE